MTATEVVCTTQAMKHLVCCGCFGIHQKAERVVVDADGGTETACATCGDRWYRAYGAARSVRVLTLPDGTTRTCVKVKFNTEPQKRTQDG